MVMSNLPTERDLAREIFTAAAGASIAADPSSADFQGLAKYAFIAAKAFAEVENANLPKLPKIQQQHLDAASKK
jgi:hypothetical protein